MNLGSLITLQTQAEPRSVLDTQTATISMVVPFYAAITEMKPIPLTTKALKSGSIVLSGSGTFRLESNGQVRVTVDSHHNHAILSHDTAIRYSLDGGGLSFKTEANKTHNGFHSIAIHTTTSLKALKQAKQDSRAFTLTASEL